MKTKKIATEISEACIRRIREHKEKYCTPIRWIIERGALMYMDNIESNLDNKKTWIERVKGGKE